MSEQSARPIVESESFWACVRLQCIYRLGRDDLAVEDFVYDQAFAAARSRVPAGWRIIALR